MPIFSTNRLRWLTVLVAPIAGAVLFTRAGEAQVFKDGAVCWSCPGDVAPEPKTFRPNARKKRAYTARAATEQTVNNASASSHSVDASLRTAIQHKVAIQVDQNDKAVMDLALNNAKNIIEYYKGVGESVAVEIVTFGPGLHMLRADTSPVKERIAPMSLENPNLAFFACGNTQANQSKTEGKPITLISEAKVTPSGVVRLMELQKQGYAYVRP